METIAHEAVMRALDARARRPHYSCNRSDTPTIDETGTVDMTDIMHVLEERDRIAATEQQERQMVRDLGITDEALRVHGVAPTRKAEGTIRLIYENANGICNRLTNNMKVEKAKMLHNDLEVDIAAYNEHRLNMKHKGNGNGFNQLFRGGEAAVRSVVAHNVHENIGRAQEGGMCILAFGAITEKIEEVDQTAKDVTGLGRWTVMTFRRDNARTRVICGYNPCYNKALDNGTSYAQHRRFLIMQRNDHTSCPRDKFREQLLHQLKQWREQGDRLIVCLDANEDIYRKALGKELTDADGLALREVVGDFTNRKIGPTFFRGSKPIDGVWATSDITVANACIMPVGYGIGDHRLFVIDFCATDVIGHSQQRALRATSRRLNTRIPGAAKKYNETLEKLIIRHNMIQKIGKAYTDAGTRDEVTTRARKVDGELGEYMTHAERNCRRIKSGVIPFSPESAIWIERTQVYRALLRHRAGQIRNVGNLKRKARKVNITDAMNITVDEIKRRIDFCEQQNEYFKRHGKYYRRQHLKRRLQAARERENDVAEKQILSIIHRERDQRFWRRVNYTLGRPRAGACFQVQVEGQEGELQEYTTQDDIHDAIWDNIHLTRFYLAEAAPICRGLLRGTFGYNAVCPTAAAILDGTYEYPPWFDGPTREILQECAAIRTKVPKDSVQLTISPEDWSNHWRGAKESTSSSISGRHFGHYKAGLQSQYITYLHALQSTLVVKSGIVLERWANGLSVMLQKIFGCSLITKLRSILLMEADFNATNKIEYGVRMLSNVRKYRLMPDEIYSERNRLADDGTLSKVIFYDIVRQLRRPACLAAVDADNCYDRISHPIASLTFQAFGVPTSAIESMLSTIQDMRFYLRTGFGDSEKFAGGPKEDEEDPIKTQGMCQGNGASPAAWTVTAITIISAHKKKGHGAHYITPILQREGHLIGNVFVDDTDLIHLEMRNNQTREEAHTQFQASIDNWGKLLLATGGALKPAKCSHYFISFEWKSDGTWRYSNNESSNDLVIKVPMADGTTEPIEHLSVNTAVKTLGFMTCPSGDNSAATQQMRKIGQEWVDRVKSGHLSRRDVWFMVDCQLWPRLGFGICNSTATWAELCNCMMRVYYQLLPKGGIRGSAPVQLRQLSRGFYGAGLPHPGVECFAQQISKLLTHYGCKNAIGLELQVSVELFVIELGISEQPFQESYLRYHKWITQTWLKTIWEKADKFNVEITLAPLDIRPPRSGDKWFMRAIIDAGFTDEEELRILNRFRCHQQVLYLSDVLEANGKSLNKRYLRKRQPSETWSNILFPNENPPNRHLTLWRAALEELAPRGRAENRLGAYIHTSRARHEWTYDPDTQEIYHRTGETMDVYRPAIHPRNAYHTNCWSKALQGIEGRDKGIPCCVRDIGPGLLSLKSSINHRIAIDDPRDLREVLTSWGFDWIWQELRITGDGSWLSESIESNSCIAVTDGSYMKEIHPTLNSAAFIFECQQGRGRLMGSFVESSPGACSYRGELLGLMATHLICLATNKLHPDLQGTVLVYSDCKGALHKVSQLPPYQVPTRCSHPDILKNIMVNCSELTFSLKYAHVKAHQDDREAYEALQRPSQLNCQMDYYAKKALLELDTGEDGETQQFPLEPICVTVGRKKITSDRVGELKYWVHKRIAKDFYHERSILFDTEFEAIDWEMVSQALQEVPRMFQVWACKQVMNLAPANGNKPWDKSNMRCPSCDCERETTAHTLECDEIGRVDALMQSIDMLERWLEREGTDPTLQNCIISYCKGRGAESMDTITYGLDQRYRQMAADQDCIGWRRFMEGMICKKAREIQETYSTVCGSRSSPQRWAIGTIIKLLEATHAQWLYRCIQMHDTTSGALRTTRKEELQREIDRQLEADTDGLLEEDQYLAEVNIENLENSAGERQEYWLLAIRAARKACRLRGLQRPLERRGNGFDRGR